jgi:cytochrome c oxidase subunit 2
MLWISKAYAGSSSMPPQASTMAADVDYLFWFLIAISTIASVLVIGGMLWFLFKYKRKSDNDKTAYITHNHLAEFLWSFIPLVLFMVCFVWGWKVFHDLRTSPENAYEVYVKGKKWAWDFEYNTGVVSPGELVVPIGKPIKLLMTSEDVLHSFYVPSFRIKQDVVPGRYTMAWFEATKLGEFQIFCTEFCGLNHSGMLAKVKVVTQEAFEAYLDGKKIEKLTPLQLGEKIYKTRNCNGCHSLKPNEVIVGPTFYGLFGKERAFNSAGSVVADENYIIESINNPNAKIVKGFNANQMPAFEGQLSEEELRGVIEFIKAQK